MQIDTQNVTDADGTRHTVFIVSIETSDEVFFLRFTASGYPAEVQFSSTFFELTFFRSMVSK